MAAFFIDIDGTTTTWGTNEFLPGAVEMIQCLQAKGHQIIFTTLRPRDGNDPLLSILKDAFGTDLKIIFGVQSPRVVINDAGAYAVNHKTDTPWEYDFRRFNQ